METWEKIAVAILGGALVIFLLPGIRAQMQNSPKGSRQEWLGALVPLTLVILFVILLILWV